MSSGGAATIWVSAILLIDSKPMYHEESHPQVSPMQRAGAISQIPAIYRCPRDRRSARREFVRRAEDDRKTRFSRLWTARARRDRFRPESESSARPPAAHWARFRAPLRGRTDRPDARGDGYKRYQWA